MLHHKQITHYKITSKLKKEKKKEYYEAEISGFKVQLFPRKDDAE